MTKIDLVNAVIDKIGFSKKESQDIVEQIFTIIKSSLEAGEKVKISGLGSWTVKDKKPRKGRNPQTGDELILDGRRVVGFKASAGMKGRLGDD